MTWTDESIGSLKTLAADPAKFTAAEIADKLGLLHGMIDLSRNAVIGKLARLKVSLPRRQGGTWPGRPRPVRTTQFRPRPIPPVAPEPQAEPLRVPEAPNSRPVGLMGLTSTTCRWPLWGEDPDEPKLYCGAESDGTYCPFHAATSIGRTYTRAERREYHRQREGDVA